VAGKWLWRGEVMEGAVELEKKAGRNRQLTERDRELCGFLAVCRYLSREQVERLMFPGRSKARSSTRLRQLAASMGGQAAVLRGDLGFGSEDGWTTVWALTAEGFEIGARQVGLQVDRVPKHDVGQAFLKHEMMLNEVFLGLVPQDGKTPAKVPRHFRWVLGEYLNLPFKEFSRETLGTEARRLQPDAMLEDPRARRRYFIEFETGSATVFDAKKTTSTLAKLQRYAEFFTGMAGGLFNDKDTWYARSFKEPWPAEVFFVTQSEARRDAIAKLITKFEQGRLTARAMTIEQAQRQFGIALYGRELPSIGAHGPTGVSASTVKDRAPALTAEEERLRRGRVSVRGEQLINFERILRASLSALAIAQQSFERYPVSPVAIPKTPSGASDALRVLAEYARRGHDALVSNGISQAD
jgi:Replication-relaxation